MVQCTTRFCRGHALLAKLRRSEGVSLFSEASKKGSDGPDRCESMWQFHYRSLSYGAAIYEEFPIIVDMLYASGHLGVPLMQDSG